MIKVPNVRLSITILSSKGCKRNFVVEKPIWFKDMYEACHAGMLDGPVEVTDIPESFSDVGRYTIFGSIDTAERETVSFFIAENKKQIQKVTTIFRRLFPDGLSAKIKELLVEDIERAKKKATVKRCSPIPHPSFIGDPNTAPGPLNEFEALNVQAKGYANLGECAKISDPMVLVECGLSPSQAVEVIELAKQSRAQTEAIAKK